MQIELTGHRLTITAAMRDFVNEKFKRFRAPF